MAAVNLVIRASEPPWPDRVKARVKRTSIVKHNVCQFGLVLDKHCLLVTNNKCWQANCVCNANMFDVVAKRASILYEQNSERLSCKTCTHDHAWPRVTGVKESCKVPVKQTTIVWQTFEVLQVKHNVCQFGHYISMFLTNIFWREWFWNFDKQNVLLKQCLSW